MGSFQSNINSWVSLIIAIGVVLLQLNKPGTLLFGWQYRKKGPRISRKKDRPNFSSAGCRDRYTTTQGALVNSRAPLASALKRFTYAFSQPGRSNTGILCPKKLYATESLWIFWKFDWALLLILFRSSRNSPVWEYWGVKPKGVLKPDLTHPDSP